MSYSDSENSKSYTNEYFEKQLDALGLSTQSIKRQTKYGLQSILAVADHAIKNHESFGKIEIQVPSEKGEIIGIRYNMTAIKIGILPLLLERYKLILDRLEQYGQDTDDLATGKDISHTEIDKTKVRAELKKIAQRETKRWFWIAIVLMGVSWVIMFFLIQIFGWNLLEPWTYLIGIGLVIASYAYFAIQQREFSPVAIYQQALESRTKRLFQDFGVDDN